MTPTRKAIVRAYLTGHVPLDLKEKDLTCTPTEIKTFIISLRPDEIRNINDSPSADIFRERSNQALSSIADAQNSKPSYGKIASGFVEFTPEEVSGKSDPKKRKQ